MTVIVLFVTGSKQKWVPINIELPKSSRARKNWPPRRDQPPETGRESSGRRDDGQRKSDGSPRKDRRDRHDVFDRDGKEQGRPNSASLKAAAAASKKGKCRAFIMSATQH